jgi:5-methylcytosine-specific restriction endonuclease McrA
MSWRDKFLYYNERIDYLKRKTSRTQNDDDYLKELQERKRRLYSAYRYSVEWTILRNAVLSRDNNQCVYCESDCNLHVHHLTYDRQGREYLSDLITLCATCHSEVHGREL